MASIGSVVVQFLADNKMGSTLGDIKRGLQGVDKEGGKTTGTFGRLNAAWAAAIPIAGAVIGAGIGIANVLIDASKAALEDKNSSDKLAGVLKKIPGITDEMISANEEWISSMQLATLVSDTDLRVAVQKLALATGDLKKAQDLTTVAVDASTVSGKSLSSVTDALAKAANGNTTALKRMYPWLDANKDGTLTYSEAVDGLTKKFKGAAAEAAKTKPWEMIQTIWGEIQESLAGVLLPLLEEFADWFSSKKNQKAVQDFINAVADLAKEIGTKLADAFRAMMDWLKKPENQQKLRDWAHMFGDIASAIGDVIRFTQTMITLLNKIPLNPLNAIFRAGGGKSAPTAAGFGPSSRAASTQAAPAAQPVVMVTEEQIARAVQRILMRSDARNGRVTRIA